MSRSARTRELPAALPPEERPVGQVVGEAMRIYGRRFWAALAIGFPVVLVSLIGRSLPQGLEQLLVVPAVAALLPLSYVLACAVALERPLRRKQTLGAYAVGVLVFLPFPFLAIFLLPALLWLAFVALAVPAAFVEGIGIPAAFARGVRLARADFVHVLGGLAALAIVVILTQAGLSFVLREFADNTRLVATILASIVVSPLVFLGAALLYVDQEARLRSREERRKERDADVPHAVHAHRKRRADAARESRPAS
jgi:hypothetical protein